jgi:hypothetical protein
MCHPLWMNVLNGKSLQLFWIASCNWNISEDMSSRLVALNMNTHSEHKTLQNLFHAMPTMIALQLHLPAHCNKILSTLSGASSVDTLASNYQINHSGCSPPPKVHTPPHRQWPTNCTYYSFIFFSEKPCPRHLHFWFHGPWEFPIMTVFCNFLTLLFQCWNVPVMDSSHVIIPERSHYFIRKDDWTQDLGWFGLAPYSPYSYHASNIFLMLNRYTLTPWMLNSQPTGFARSQVVATCCYNFSKYNPCHVASFLFGLSLA